jgi:cyclopropane fatty-acyl-phospholipid synthase-like methyltransferase
VRTVEAGYDGLVDRYLTWSGDRYADPAARMLDVLDARLRASARVLDLGCGAGVPWTQRLATRYEVTGVDVSSRQLRAARANVPAATFVLADLSEVEFPDRSFDAAVSLYSLSHVPREHHGRVFERIFGWLVPGGLFVANVGARDAPDWTGEWLGVEMFFSAFDADVNRSLLSGAGFELIESEVAETHEPDGPVPFLWVVARRPL